MRIVFAALTAVALLLGANLLAGAFGQSLPNPASPEPAAAAEQADMSISKTATPDPAVLGQKLTYTVTVVNNGPGTATNVLGADRLPPEVKFESATATKGGACFVTDLVQCPIGTMGSGETVTMTIVVTVAERPFEGDSITNFCSVFSDDDPNPVNDHCRVDTKVIENVLPPPPVVEEGPCIPEAAFTELDGMKNFLRKTIKRVEDEELNADQLKKRTKQLEVTKHAMLRAHFPPVFGVKYVALFRQLEGFDSKMGTVRTSVRIAGVRPEGQGKVLKLGQEDLEALEALLGQGEGVPEGAFTEVDSMKNFLRKTIKRLKDGELSADELKKRTKQLDKTKLAMLRAHFATVCGVKYVALFRQLEGFDSKMGTVRTSVRIAGVRPEGQGKVLKLAQEDLQDLETVLRGAQ